jgi:hypothetical protein
VLTTWVLLGRFALGGVEPIDYSTFIQDVDAGKIAAVTIDPQGQVDGH